MELEQKLNEHFGYPSFRTGQKEVIEQLLDGRDVIALLPTGMGKSLCYQLPGYVFDKPVLIVSPLLSLMQDQVDQLKRLGEKRVVALNSFLSLEQKKYALHFLHEYRFIFTSPEMLTQPQVRERLAQIELSLVVADEAHCISQWGFDFRPDYLRIGEVLMEKRPPILALSATATLSVLEDIKAYLHMQEPFMFIHNVDRPNIHIAQNTFMVKEEKFEWILQHVKNSEGPGIIYTQSRNKAENFSRQLLEHGIVAAAYHAGKDAEDRQFIQQQFIAGDLQWIVATNAFGMGVHKNDIRQVIHESMPANISNYMQEIGRAGRDGKDALAILLYAEGDEHFAKYLATEDIPKKLHVDSYEQYRQAHQSPDSMLHAGEISETAYRVLDYWMGQESIEAVKQRLVNMEIRKYEAVHEMMNIVLGSGCMREKIVSYFGQQLTHRPPNCCQNCGIDIEQLLIPRSEVGIKQRITWEERLQNLLFADV